MNGTVMLSEAKHFWSISDAARPKIDPLLRLAQSDIMRWLIGLAL